MTTAVSSARIPSLPRRVVFASLRLAGLLVFFVAVPLGVLNDLAAHGITPPYSAVTVSAVGVVLAVLGAAGTIARPTRSYGPIAFVASVGLFVYLLALAKNGIVTVGVGSGATLQLSYGGAILLLALMPVLGAIAAMFTILEDGLSPGERLPYDYPPTRR
ncbi:MAG TPA: hypothetical protein VN864_05610 [Thermoplasmata archaeon]|nr:hypothetical protein [Thermoplasmata archaeon]